MECHRQQQQQPGVGSSPRRPSIPRWKPTPCQISVLLELYKRGVRSPSSNQIEIVLPLLRQYGKIEAPKSVFYWFQNHHRAREKKIKMRSTIIYTTPAGVPTLSQDFITSAGCNGGGGGTIGHTLWKGSGGGDPYSNQLNPFLKFQRRINAILEQPNGKTLPLFPLHTENVRKPEPDDCHVLCTKNDFKLMV